MQPVLVAPGRIKANRKKPQNNELLPPNIERHLRKHLVCFEIIAHHLVFQKRRHDLTNQR